MYRIGGLMRYMRTRGHGTCGCVLPVVATQRVLRYGTAASRRSSTPRHLLFDKRNFSSEGSSPLQSARTNETPGHNRWLSTPRVVLASAVLGAAGVAWISGRGGKKETTSSPPEPSVNVSDASVPAEPLERRVATSSIDDDGEYASSEVAHTSSEKKSLVSIANDIDETRAEEGEPLVVATATDKNEEEKEGEGAKLSSDKEEAPPPRGEVDISEGENDAKGADVNDQEESVVDAEGVEGDERSAKGSVKLDEGSAKGSVKVVEGSAKVSVEIDEGSAKDSVEVDDGRAKGSSKVDNGNIAEQSGGSKLSDGSDRSQVADQSSRTEEEEALGESSGASEGKQLEETGSAQSEEEEECGFCVFLKAGPCGTEFEVWQKCVDDTQKQGRDIVMECLEKTRILKECMEAHVDYYGEILALEKTDEKTEEKTEEKTDVKTDEKTDEAQDQDNNRQSDQGEKEGGERRSEEKAPTSPEEQGREAVNQGGDGTSRKENKGGDAEREDKGGVGEDASIEEGESGGIATDEEAEKHEKILEQADSNVDGESSGNVNGGDNIETGAGAASMSSVRCVGDKCEFVRKRVLRKKNVVDEHTVAASSSADKEMEKLPTDQASKD